MACMQLQQQQQEEGEEAEAQLGSCSSEKLACLLIPWIVIEPFSFLAHFEASQSWIY